MWAVVVWILLSCVLACAPQRPPSSEEAERPCGSRTRPERRLLQFQHTARHDALALDAGRYRFELTHESYAAACDIDVSSAPERQAGKAAWSATCEGDEVEIGSFFERIFGLLVPAHLPNVRARVTRDRAVVFDDVVTATSQCHGSMDTPGVAEPVEGPGALCLSFSREHWDAVMNIDDHCKRRFVGEPQQELHFAHGDGSRASLGGGEYRFELAGERYSSACDVSVPVPDPHRGEVVARCKGDELHVWTGVASIRFMQLPARLRSVRVLATRGSAVIFAGVAAGAEACQQTSVARSSERLCFYLAPDSTLAESASDAIE